MNAKARVLGAILALALCGGRAAADEVAAWLESAPEASAYASVRDRIEATAALAAKDGVPDRLLALRLVEGAHKRAAPTKLAAALEEEERRLASLAALLAGRNLPPQVREELIEQGGILLRAGAVVEDIGLPLAAAESGPEGARRAFAAASAVSVLNARFALDSDARIRLPTALVRSKVPREGFSSLVSIFTKWRAKGLTAKSIASAAIAALESGASIERVDQEIERRSTNHE
jgi:hypothetical protein